MKARKRTRTEPLPPAIQTKPAPIVEPAEPAGGRAIIFIRRPRCPYCGATKLTINGTHGQGDGTQLRYYACRRSACRRTFKCVVE